LPAAVVVRLAASRGLRPCACSTARRLLTAVEEVNAAYPEGYAAWRREQDERIAGQRLEEQRRAAAPQAILDRVMDEYRSGQ
jgi:hypothetical protein